MKASASGSRYPLYQYTQVFNRLWHTSLALGVMLTAAWSCVRASGAAGERWLFGAAIPVLLFSLAAYLARSRTYVQAGAAHLRIATPLLLLKIPYDQITRIYFGSADPRRTLQTTDLPAVKGRAAGPERTGIIVELCSRPLNSTLLKLLLPQEMLLNGDPGLILSIPDPTAFLAEANEFLKCWREVQEQTLSPANAFRS